VSADTIRETMDEAGSRLKEAGGQTAEAPGQAVAALAEDWGAVHVNGNSI